MTLSIASLSPSGIVLTADSRQTYPNSIGMTRIGTDNANKLFQLSETAGVVIAGKAFFADSKGVLKSTGWFIEQFKNTLKPGLSIQEIATQLNEYFTENFINPEEKRLQELFKKDIAEKTGGTDINFLPRDGLKVPYSYLKDGNKVEKEFFIELINLIVGGIDEDGVGRAYIVSVPDKPTITRDTEYGGPLWIGQTDVIGRIIKGTSWEIDTLPFVKNAKAEGVDVKAELNGMEYIINWNIMTLQDSIDFCVLVTQITESIQRFSDGTVLNPGEVTGVGGPIDVATITVGEGFKWIRKKELTVL